MSDVRQCDICGRTRWDKDDPEWGVLITTCLEWEEFDVCPTCIGVLRAIKAVDYLEDGNKLEQQYKRKEQFSRRED